MFKVLFAVLLSCVVSVNFCFGEISAVQVNEIWPAKGGVAVELDGEDGSLLTGLCKDRPGRLMHALMRSDKDIVSTRLSLQKSGVHGQVTVSSWDGETIPFVDNFINLLICSPENAPSEKEIMRVLTPLVIPTTTAGLTMSPMARVSSPGLILAQVKLVNVSAMLRPIGFITAATWLRPLKII